MPPLVLLLDEDDDEPPQSCGQKTADSPGEQTPSPHVGPPLDEAEVDEAEVADEAEVDDEDADVEELLEALLCEDECVLVVVVGAPPAPPVCEKKSS